jgi:hypothetical protein
MFQLPIVEGCALVFSQKARSTSRQFDFFIMEEKAHLSDANVAIVRLFEDAKINISQRIFLWPLVMCELESGELIANALPPKFELFGKGIKFD